MHVLHCHETMWKARQIREAHLWVRFQLMTAKRAIEDRKWVYFPYERTSLHWGDDYYVDNVIGTPWCRETGIKAGHRWRVQAILSSEKLPTRWLTLYPLLRHKCLVLLTLISLNLWPNIICRHLKKCPSTSSLPEMGTEATAWLFVKTKTGSKVRHAQPRSRSSVGARSDIFEQALRTAAVQKKSSSYREIQRGDDLYSAKVAVMIYYVTITGSRVVGRYSQERWTKASSENTPGYPIDGHDEEENPI